MDTPTEKRRERKRHNKDLANQGIKTFVFRTNDLP